MSWGFTIEPRRTWSNAAEGPCVGSVLAAGCWELVEPVPMGASEVLVAAPTSVIGVGRLTLTMSLCLGGDIATSR